MLPKLREENLNNPSKGGKGGGGAGGKKRKGWKDVVVTGTCVCLLFWVLVEGGFRGMRGDFGICGDSADLANGCIR